MKFWSYFFVLCVPFTCKISFPYVKIAAWQRCLACVVHLHRTLPFSMDPPLFLYLNPLHISIVFPRDDTENVAFKSKMKIKILDEQTIPSYNVQNIWFKVLSIHRSSFFTSKNYSEVGSFACELRCYRQIDKHRLASNVLLHTRFFASGLRMKLL